VLLPFSFIALGCILLRPCSMILGRMRLRVLSQSSNALGGCTSTLCLENWFVRLCLLDCIIQQLHRCSDIVKFVKRQAIAHLLARAANSWASRCVFYFIPPRAANSLHFSRMSGVYLIQLE
jgi:hypothetical protein